MGKGKFWGPEVLEFIRREMPEVGFTFGAWWMEQRSIEGHAKA